jgi:hypothetical protein
MEWKVDKRNRKDWYELEELIKKMEALRDEPGNESNTFNLPKALYSLALEIQDLKKEK